VARLTDRFGAAQGLPLPIDRSIDRHTSYRGAVVGIFVKGDIEEVATMFAAGLDDLSYDDLLPSCRPRAWCSAASERNASPEAQWPRLPHEFLSTSVRGRFKQFGGGLIASLSRRSGSRLRCRERDNLFHGLSIVGFSFGCLRASSILLRQRRLCDRPCLGGL